MPASCCIIIISEKRPGSGCSIFTAWRVLSGIYLVKFLVLKFMGWVFSISRATDIYIFVVFLGE